MTVPVQKWFGWIGERCKPADAVMARIGPDIHGHTILVDLREIDRIAALARG